MRLVFAAWADFGSAGAGVYKYLPTAQTSRAGLLRSVHCWFVTDGCGYSVNSLGDLYCSSNKLERVLDDNRPPEGEAVRVVAVVVILQP